MRGREDIRDSTERAFFEELHDAYYRKILAYCLRRVSAQDAPDVTAEVFAIAWRKREEVPEGPDGLPWLYAVARRVLSQHRRTTGRRRRLLRRLSAATGTNPSPGPEEQLLSSQAHRLAMKAADQLSASEQEVLRLRFWEELNYRDIGIVLGISAQAARQRLHRAKDALGRTYEDLGGRSHRTEEERAERRGS